MKERERDAVCAVRRKAIGLFCFLIFLTGCGGQGPSPTSRKPEPGPDPEPLVVGIQHVASIRTSGAPRGGTHAVAAKKGTSYLWVEVKVRNPSVLFGAVNLVELKAVEGAEEYPLIAYNPFGQEQGTEVPTAILLHDASGREIRLGSLFSLDGQLLVEDCEYSQDPTAGAESLFAYLSNPHQNWDIRNPRPRSVDSRRSQFLVADPDSLSLGDHLETSQRRDSRIRTARCWRISHCV